MTFAIKDSRFKIRFTFPTSIFSSGGFRAIRYKSSPDAHVPAHMQSGCGLFASIPAAR
ncbi:MAG: hypothetical protein LW721_13250 [Flammeovirgaceae bacterium]|nr:hypothetical protein [Flammeovirgaceae bacterium]